MSEVAGIPEPLSPNAVDNRANMIKEVFPDLGPTAEIITDCMAELDITPEQADVLLTRLVGTKVDAIDITTEEANKLLYQSTTS